MSTTLIIAIAVVIALAAAAIVTQRERRYGASLREAARALGLDYQPKGPPLGDIAFMNHVATRWRRRAVRHSIRGTYDGNELWFFEYGEIRSTGRSHHVHPVSVAAFPIERANAVPGFHLRPEHLADRILHRLGRAEIDFAHRPEFSRAYVVRGDSEDAIRRLFTDELVGVLLQDRRWMLDVENGWLVARRGRRRVRPGDFGVFLREAARLRGLILAA